MLSQSSDKSNIEDRGNLVQHGREGGAERGGDGGSPCINSQEAESEEFQDSARFLLFMQSGIPVLGIVLPTFRVDFHISFNLV